MEKTKGFDNSLLIVITLLFIIGELLIASTTHVFDGGGKRRVFIQLVTFAIGMCTMPLVRFIDYRDLKKYYIPIYAIGIVFLLLVYVPGLGSVQGGARGWLDLGPINIQPIEITKVTFIISYGAYLEDRAGRLNKVGDVLKALIMPAPIILLLVAQPDMGGAIIFICITFGMLFVAGINLKIVLVTLVTLVLLFPLLYFYGLELILDPYQAKRIYDFFGGGATGSEHVYQSLITIVSGGLFGKGAFKGDQNRFGFLPVSDSDFIFAVAGEEYGIVGMVIIIFLYFKFLQKLLQISSTAKELYGSLIVIGITSMFTYQFIQNIGMTIGLLPVTGLPLPFVSYGGSAMVMNMIQILIVQAVASKRKTLNF